MNERIQGPTPNGGSYALIYYYDKNNKAVDKNLAFKAIICEFNKQGKLLKETTMILKK